MAQNRYKKELLEVFLQIRNKGFLEKFLEDLLTPKELEEIIIRWQIVKQLFKRIPQRQISKNLKVSVATVTRGSRVLMDQESTFYQILRNEKLLNNQKYATKKKN